MNQVLSFVTSLVNLVGLAVSLCLGLYIVTRTPRSRLSWLAALTLWILSGYFLHNALVISWPGSGILPLLRPIVILAMPFGFHLILLVPPEDSQWERWFYQPPLRLPEGIRKALGSLALPISRVAVPLAYVLALALALGGAFPLGLTPEDVGGPALYLSDRVAGPLYPLSIAYLVALDLLALVHVWQGLKQASSPSSRRRYTSLLVALALTGLGGLYLGLGVWLQLGIPSIPGDAAIGMAVIILGYAVARYNAAVEGRVLRRELLYIALIIGSFTLSYVIAAEIFYLGGHLFSTLTLILIVVAATTSLMLYDGLRTTLDRFFYREQFRHLRANLRALAREAGTGQSLRERLQAILSALCRTLKIQNGFIALRKDETFACEVTEKAAERGRTFAAKAFLSDEIATLPRPDGDSPEGMALLVPIHDGDEQIGALVLGPRETGASYGEEDLLLLEDLADELADVIQASQLQEKNVGILTEMVAEFRERERALQRRVQEMLAEREEEARPVLAGIDEKEFVSLVEDALRRLHDYPYLGEHSLASLRIVDWQLMGQDEPFITHVDRGKALSEVAVQALEKLRPEGAEPDRHTIPQREWHQFIVLYDAYVLGELNRDIMSKLYIGEGTFNRTRRRALRGVAKALQEMEREARRRL
jgi:hypothetical protein